MPDSSRLIPQRTIAFRRISLFTEFKLKDYLIYKNAGDFGFAPIWGPQLLPFAFTHAFIWGRSWRPIWTQNTLRFSAISHSFAGSTLRRDLSRLQI